MRVGGHHLHLHRRVMDPDAAGPSH
jgi:hypothetical protein